MKESQEIIFEFIEECRNKEIINDDFNAAYCNLLNSIRETREILSTTEKGKELFNKLEDDLYNTLNLAKKRYFKYGLNCGNVTQGQKSI